MSRIRIYPYKQGSKSAKQLAEVLDGKVLKHVGSKYNPRRGDVVINWGSSNLPAFAPATSLNPRTEVAHCKLKSLREMLEEGVRVPPYSTQKGDWEENDFPVVCRTKLKGHSGEGIVIANNKEELVDAPLYTKYIKKKDEYRVHIFKNEVFFIQRKARKLDVENPDWKIRNLAGGFVFSEVVENEVPADVLAQARAAIVALHLDFGGVDVMWNEREQKAYVLEINTACGLEERTADKYKEKILDYIENQKP